MNRRKFITQVGYVTLVVQAVAMTKSFGANEEKSANKDSLVVLSTGFRFPHTHFIKVPFKDIANPPEKGITIKTSPASAPFYLDAFPLMYHTHDVKLTQKDLQDIQVGRVINVHDSSGVHTFTIKMT